MKAQPDWTALQMRLMRWDLLVRRRPTKFLAVAETPPADVSHNNMEAETATRVAVC